MSRAGRAHLPARYGFAPCRHCGQALTVLERLRGTVCGRLTCRRSETERQLAEARAADLQRRRTRAAKVWHEAAPARAAVVWLQPHRTRLVAVRAADRREQLAHLAVLAAPPGTAVAPPALPEPAPEPPPGTPAAGPVCGFCRGRCCRDGAFTHAFIDRALLQRWAEAHPGLTLHDAAADYAARLPRHHVEGSCLHHGREGCTLPRDMRSDICNRHACDGLVEARQHLAAGAPDGLVVAMPAEHRVERAAWVGEAGTRRLTRRPR